MWNNETPTMQPWSAEHYMGTRYDDYLVLAVKNRDSGLLQQCNYTAAVAEVRKAGVSVRIAVSSHWLCGWVEMALIRKDDAKGVALGNNIVARLAEYPLLDEEAFDKALDEARARLKKDIEENPDQWKSEEPMSKEDLLEVLVFDEI
jgi:hypothetical protein